MFFDVYETRACFHMNEIRVEQQHKHELKDLKKRGL
jgi:hypothetical protein